MSALLRHIGELVPGTNFGTWYQFSKFRSNTKGGQTILELVFFNISILSFLAIAGYFFTLLEVAQNQTALLRTQAFIELGNHSSYGQAGHGNDDTSEPKSQIRFELGKNNDFTRVNLEESEDFKAAVEGELNIRLFKTELGRSRAETQDIYWPKFHFPKAVTKVAYIENGDEPLIEETLVQSLTIVHNRSLNQSFSENDINPALFSGSMHFNDYAKVAGTNVQERVGLADNVEDFKDAIRQLATNDSSLSEEADSLLGSVSAEDALASGAQAAAISAAISIGISFGLSGLGSVADGGTFAAGAQGGLNDFAGQFGVEGLAGSLGNGSLAQGLFDSFVGEPVKAAGQGFADMGSGFATGGLGGAVQVGSGVSQVGSTASLYGGLAGLDVAPIQQVSTLAGAPAALQGALGSFKGAISNFNADSSFKNFTAVTDTIAGVTTPITNVATIFAPAIAAPMSFVNIGLSVPGAINGVGEGLTNLKNMDLGKVQGLKDAGVFAQDVGILASSVGAIMQNQEVMMAGGMVGLAGTAAKGLGNIADLGQGIKAGTMGGWEILEKGGSVLAEGGAIVATTGSLAGQQDIAMMGGLVGLAGMGASGVGGLRQEMKAHGMELINPVSMVEFSVKKNVEGLKSSMKSFDQEMNVIGAEINQNYAQALGGQSKISQQEPWQQMNTFMTAAGGQVAPIQIGLAKAGVDMSTAENQAHLQAVADATEYEAAVRKGMIERDQEKAAVLQARAQKGARALTSQMSEEMKVRDVRLANENLARAAILAKAEEDQTLFDSALQITGGIQDVQGLERFNRAKTNYFNAAMDLTMQIDSQTAIVSDHPSQARENYAKLSHFLYQSAEQKDYTPHARYRMRGAAKKIHRLKIYSHREAFEALRDAYLAKLEEEVN